MFKGKRNDFKCVPSAYQWTAGDAQTLLGVLGKVVKLYNNEVQIIINAMWV